MLLLVNYSDSFCLYSTGNVSWTALKACIISHKLIQGKFTLFSLLLMKVLRQREVQLVVQCHMAVK